VGIGGARALLQPPRLRLPQLLRRQQPQQLRPPRIPGSPGGQPPPLPPPPHRQPQRVALRGGEAHPALLLVSPLTQVLCLLIWQCPCWAFSGVRLASMLALVGCASSSGRVCIYVNLPCCLDVLFPGLSITAVPCDPIDQKGAAEGGADVDTGGARSFGDRREPRESRERAPPVPREPESRDPRKRVNPPPTTREGSRW